MVHLFITACGSRGTSDRHNRQCYGKALTWVPCHFSHIKMEYMVGRVEVSRVRKITLILQNTRNWRMVWKYG